MRVFIFFLTFLPQLVFAQLTLDIVYPKEGQAVSAADSTFIFGSVSQPPARVFINGQPVKMYPNGAFLGVVPVRPGEFVFHGLAVSEKDSAEATRTVTVTPPLTATPRDSLAIDTSLVLPGDDVELLAGDVLEVAFKGTPGQSASFGVAGLTDSAAMVEETAWNEWDWAEAVFGQGALRRKAAVAGVYVGTLKIPAGVTLRESEIEFTLTDSSGNSIHTTARGRLSVFSEEVPRIARVVEPQVKARTGPGLGYEFFLAQGVKLQITGKRKDFFRARLSQDEEVWVPAASIELLPAGTPIPSSRVRLLRTQSLADRVRLHIYLEERLPFKVKQKPLPAGLILTLYGGVADTDWIRYDSADEFLRGISWSQPAEKVYRVELLLNEKQQWGFDAFYEGRDLILEIMKAPAKLSLKNLFIGLDPGHGPDEGAIGPTRLTERDANLQTAQILKRKLEEKGAHVFLTRHDRHGITLTARARVAAFLQPDLLVSLHYNALPDGVNPFRNRGSSTYYYHPQSRALAAAIQKRMLEKLRLANYGLFYDNLAICRITQMPVVLVEPAFIMHPEEEMLIRSKKFMEKTADAIVKGIEDFLKQARE